MREFETSGDALEWWLIARVFDRYCMYASSALSAMSFARNLVGSVCPLFTTQMYDALGIQGAGGLCVGLATLLAATPFVLYKFGSPLRQRSPFAVELQRLAAEQALDKEKVPGKERVQGQDAD